MPKGVVVGLEESYARVRYLRHSACSQCGACKLGRSEQQLIEVNALNRASAQLDDIVQVEMIEGHLLYASFLAYGIPLISFLIGLFLGSLLSLNDGYTALLSLLFLLTSYVFTRKVLEPWFKRKNKFQLVITEVLEHED